MTDDILDRAKSIQRGVADGTTVSVKLSTLQEMIAEIERLRAEMERRRNRPFQPQDDLITPASTPLMELAGKKKSS